jgi:hypothetical protein
MPEISASDIEAASSSQMLSRDIQKNLVKIAITPRAMMK